MSDWGYLPDVSRFGEDDSTGYKKQVNAGTANTKGSWVELSASCPFDSDEIIFSIQDTLNASAQTAIVDIGVGGAGSEVVLVPNLCTGGITFYSGGPIARLPVCVPAGTRVAARIASTLASGDYYLKLHFSCGHGILPVHCATDYGTDTGNSRGTAVTAGTSNAEGSWAQLTASCSPMSYMLIMVNTLTTTPADIALDIGVGGAGSEQLVISNLLFLLSAIVGVSSSYAGVMSPWLLLPFSVKAGTRIAARIKCTTNSQVAYVSIIGFA